MYFRPEPPGYFLQKQLINCGFAAPFEPCFFVLDRMEAWKIAGAAHEGNKHYEFCTLTSGVRVLFIELDL